MRYIIPFADQVFYLSIEKTNKFRDKLLKNYRIIRKSQKRPLCTIEIIWSGKKTLTKPITINIVNNGRGQVILWRRGKQITSHAIDFFLLVLLQFFCWKNKIYLVHASAIVLKSTSYLFLGPQGAGKSTVTKYVSNSNILSDDNTILAKRNNSYYIYPSAFDGFKANIVVKKKFRLGKVLILKKSQKTYIDDISDKERKRKILSASFYYMYLRKIRLGTRSDFKSLVSTEKFGWADELISKVPVYNLYFQKNNKFIKLLK